MSRTMPRSKDISSDPGEDVEGFQFQFLRPAVGVFTSSVWTPLFVHKNVHVKGTDRFLPASPGLDQFSCRNWPDSSGCVRFQSGCLRAS